MSTTDKNGKSSSSGFLPPISSSNSSAHFDNDSQSGYSSRNSSFLFSRHNSRHSNFNPSSSSSPTKLPALNSDFKRKRSGPPQAELVQLKPEELSLRWKALVSEMSDIGGESEDDTGYSSVKFPSHEDTEPDSKLQKVVEANQPSNRGLSLPRINGGLPAEIQGFSGLTKRHRSHSTERSTFNRQNGLPEIYSSNMTGMYHGHTTERNTQRKPNGVTLSLPYGDSSEKPHHHKKDKQSRKIKGLKEADPERRELGGIFDTMDPDITKVSETNDMSYEPSGSSGSGLSKKKRLKAR